MDMNKDAPAQNEWSVLVAPEHIKDLASHMNIAADAEALMNLTRRLSLIELSALSAHITLKKEKGGRIIHVTGTFDAQLSQECVVSGQPVALSLNAEPIEGWFADPNDVISLQKARRDKAIQAGNEMPILEEADDPEPFVHGKIDVGELVTQSLSLALPSYPRAEGVDFDGHRTSADEDDPAFANPFAALKDWKKETKG